MQMEHVTNTETVIGTIYQKAEKIGVKNQRTKRRKNALKIMQTVG